MRIQLKSILSLTILVLLGLSVVSKAEPGVDLSGSFLVAAPRSMSRLHFCVTRATITEP